MRKALKKTPYKKRVYRRRSWRYEGLEARPSTKFSFDHTKGFHVEDPIITTRDFDVQVDFKPKSSSSGVQAVTPKRSSSTQASIRKKMVRDSYVQYDFPSTTKRETSIQAGMQVKSDFVQAEPQRRSDSTQVDWFEDPRYHKRPFIPDWILWGRKMKKQKFLPKDDRMSIRDTFKTVSSTGLDGHRRPHSTGRVSQLGYDTQRSKLPPSKLRR